MAGVLEVTVWWAACVGVWLLTLSSFDVPDLVTAAVCALLCAVAARSGRRAVGGRWRPRLRWARWLVVLVPAVLVETVRVLALAPRLRGADGLEGPGELEELELPADRPEPVAKARHAVATWLLSASPGSFVVESDPASRRLLVHTLTRGKPDLKEVVRR